MALVNRSAVTVRPRQPMLDWLHPFSTEDERQQLHLNSSVYLLSDGRDEQQAWQQLQAVCERLFCAELELWCRDRQRWPQPRDFTLFLQWFSISFHPLVEDLSGDPLQHLRLDDDLLSDLKISLGGVLDPPLS